MADDLTFSPQQARIISLLGEILDTLRKNGVTTAYTRCGCGHTWTTGQKHDCLLDCCGLAA